MTAPMTPNMAGAVAAMVAEIQGSIAHLHQHGPSRECNPEAARLQRLIDDANTALTATQEQLERCRAETLEEAVAVIRSWKRRDHLSLHAGEVTTQEWRTVVAVLTSIEGALRSLAKPIEGGQGG